VLVRIDDRQVRGAGDRLIGSWQASRKATSRSGDAKGSRLLQKTAP
jgi:hypothetical protein